MITQQKTSRFKEGPGQSDVRTHTVTRTRSSHNIEVSPQKIL
jgi:hypothetical protein